MAIAVSKIDARRAIAAVERALAEGFPPPGEAVRRGSRGAVAEAARRLSINAVTLWGRIKPGGPCESAHGLRVDWTKWKRPNLPPSPPSADVAPPDAVELRRLRDQLHASRAAEAAAERRVACAEDFRSSILGLSREPLKPSPLPPPARSAGAGGRSIIAHLSDVHRGEAVSLAEMDGVNVYNAAVSRARLGRYFDAVASLATEHWHGAPPDEIVLCLGGDLIGGMIHAELTETNDVAVPRSVRDLGEEIAGGLAMWRKRIGRPIRVISVPGNHARLTMKPQAKRRAAHNLDLLVADFAEAAVRGAGVGPAEAAFFATASPDAYFSTYGWAWCLTHGDAMGVGGGKGYIGPIAPITKGHRLLFDTAQKTGRRIHYVLTAHYHTTARTPFGWGNGSVISWNEYARDLRADPEPAKQNMLIVHERRGVIGHMELYLGAPEEGLLHRGPRA
jgi:hypothetical protein